MSGSKNEDPKPEDRVQDLDDPQDEDDVDDDELEDQDDDNSSGGDDDSGSSKRKKSSSTDDDSGNDPKPDKNHPYRDDIKKAVKRRQDALKKARDLEKENRDLKAQNETEVEKAKREASEKASEEAANKYKPVIVRKEAEAGLLEAGVKQGKIKRLIKLMDLDDIEIDDNGEVEGVDDQVEVVKEEYPELFGSDNEKETSTKEEKPKTKPKAPRDPDGAPRKPAQKPKTSAEIHAERLSGGR